MAVLLLMGFIMSVRIVTFVDSILTEVAMRIVLVQLACMICLAPFLMAQDEDVLRPNGRPAGWTGRAGSSSSTVGSIVFGPEAGLNVNFFSSDLTRDRAISRSPEDVLKSGLGVSYNIGLFADFPIAKTMGIQARVAWDNKQYSNSISADIDAVTQPGPVVIAGQSPVVSMQTTADVQFSMNTVAAAVLLRFDITEQFFATVGPYATFLVGDAIRTDKLTWVGPENTWINVDYEGTTGQYIEISRESNFAPNFLPAIGSDPNAYSASTYSSTRVGFELGVGYRIPISKGVYLAPNARYQLMLTELTTEYRAPDISQVNTQGSSNIVFGKGSLNTLAVVLQLGVEL